MTRLNHWPIALLLLSLLVLLCPACAAVLVAGGVGAGVTWHQNAMRSTIEAEPEQVIHAAEQVFNDMNITTLQTPSIDAEQARITGRMPDRTRIRVRARAQEHDTSRLIVRAGFADRQRSLQLHDRIVDELGLQPIEDIEPPTAVR